MLQLDNRMCHKWQSLTQVSDICDCIIVSHAMPECRLSRSFCKAATPLRRLPCGFEITWLLAGLTLLVSGGTSTWPSLSTPCASISTSA